MKSLFPILGITFLSLTLTNCSLSPEKIASQLEPSIVKLSYRNQPGYGTGFFVDGELGVCTILTAAHVVKKEGERVLRTEQDQKLWDVATVEIFPSSIDLALVTFQPGTGKCNYPALKMGNSESLRIGSSIFIYGFSSRGGEAVTQFVDGKISALKNLAWGYGVSYKTLSVGEMSGAPVMDKRGKVVAVNGMSERGIVQSLASQQASLSQLERQLSQEAEESLKTSGVQRLTFSWGIPIAFFRESEFYSPDADISGWGLWILFSSGVIFGSSVVYFGLRHSQTLQVFTQRQTELKRQLNNEQSRRQEVEERLSSLQNIQTQAEKDWERQLEWERSKRQEVEALLERERQVQSQVIKPQFFVDVPLVSAVGVNYTKLRDLLAAQKWKEADLETEERMLEVAGRESEGYFQVEDVESFPCQDLGTIDKLWLKYSNGKFGFSVQKQIYQGLGGTKEYDLKVWISFGDKVGWRKEGKWLSYDGLTFSDQHYTGHLPTVPGAVRFGVDAVYFELVETIHAEGVFHAEVFAEVLGLFSRAESCNI